ncbi:hypothetical protein [Acidovorax sp. sic0104]|uniref:hypothetical protein n=1 Tax=Acidovorax sp. sic0104 TaxID=2854784 RepID=UPI0021078922|nr:hypothetical protein [Acidovorax sp. sic0104]
MTAHRLQRAGLCLAVMAAALVLQACDRTAGNAGTTQPVPAGSSAAEAEFDTLVAACTRSLAARVPLVQESSPGETGSPRQWTQTGYSPAQVQREVTRTDSPITPYVGKIVVKDNVAQASAGSQTEASAITLTPAHLRSNRTHTFIYSFDGQKWRWNNGLRLTKVPSQNDESTPLALADVAADKGLAGCLPR